MDQVVEMSNHELGSMMNNTDIDLFKWFSFITALALISKVRFHMFVISALMDIWSNQMKYHCILLAQIHYTRPLWGLRCAIMDIPRNKMLCCIWLTVNKIYGDPAICGGNTHCYNII